MPLDSSVYASPVAGLAQSLISRVTIKTLDELNFAKQSH
jgi:hypothetical protein